MSSVKLRPDLDFSYRRSINKLGDSSPIFASRKDAAREVAKQVLGDGKRNIKVIEIIPFSQRNFFAPLSIVSFLWANTFGREKTDYPD